MDDREYTPRDSTSNSNTDADWTKCPTLEELIETHNKLKASLPQLYIWRGEQKGLDKYRLFTLNKEPELRFSEYLPAHHAYIIAGTGILAGSFAYDYLKSQCIQLQWSDDYIPLEVQNVYSLLKLLVIKEKK